MSPDITPPRPIETPCVKVCAVDGASGYCIGCRRTLAEIASWSRMSEQQRTDILTALPARPKPAPALMTGLT